MGYYRLKSISYASNYQKIVRVDEIRSSQTHVPKNLSCTAEIDCGWCRRGRLKIVQKTVAPVVDVAAPATDFTAPFGVQ